MNLKNHRKQFNSKLRKLCKEYDMMLSGHITHVYARKNCNQWDYKNWKFSSHPRLSAATLGFNLLKK